MCHLSRFWLPVFLGLGLSLTAGTASAGWVCITNESKLTLVILEVPDHPAIKRGKVIRLLPGETYREYHLTPGEKRFHILDVHTSSPPLFFGWLKWPKGDVSLRIRSTEGVVTVVPVAPIGGSEPAVVTVSAVRSKP